MWYNILLDIELLQTVFFVVAIIFFIVVGALALPALLRINRILGRVDSISKDLVGPAKHLARAAAALQESAIAAGVAYFIKKAHDFMENRNEDHNNQPPRRVI